MKYLILLLIIAMNLGCGDDTPVDSCKNSCGEYANCNNGDFIHKTNYIFPLQFLFLVKYSIK